MTNLQQRCLAALVMIPCALYLIWAGGIGYRLFIACIGCLCLGEWFGLLTLRGSNAPRGRIAWGAYLAGLAAIFCDKNGLAVIIFVAGAVVLLLGEWRKNRAIAIWSALGVFYIGTSTISLLTIRFLPGPALAFTLFVFLGVWMTDSCAYFAGSSLRGPKLAPRISPSKTWSGLLGGIAGAAATGFCIAASAHIANPIMYVFWGALLAIIAQSGDLLESALKRFCDTKDSGRVIPGHGGVLDRVDGLLAVALCLACVYRFSPLHPF